MNDKYFFCMDCFEYVNAGYRWSYHTLEKPGLIRLEAIIEPAKVLQANEYWSCDAELLHEVLCAAKDFLEKHQQHRVRYSDFEFISGYDDYPWYLWLCSDAKDDGEFLPRHYIEHEGITSLARIREIIAAEEKCSEANLIEEPKNLFWWGDEDSMKELEDHWQELLDKYGNKSS